MSNYYSEGNHENRFEDFVESTNKKIEELEAKIVQLQKELNKINSSVVKKDIVNIPNLDIRGSLGATIKTVGDIVK